jgi:hypothetical protein
MNEENENNIIDEDEEKCPSCGGAVFPTCLGCGCRYCCSSCDWIDPCGCTDGMA